MIFCDQMSGFMQVYKCRNKSTEEALLKMREWSANYGFPRTLVADSSQCFKNRFEEECAKLGVRVDHSSAYNPFLQLAVESSVGNLKHLLKRSSHINQLQLSEMVLAINSRIKPNDTGSPIFPKRCEGTTFAKFFE